MNYAFKEQGFPHWGIVFLLVLLSLLVAAGWLGYSHISESARVAVAATERAAKAEAELQARLAAEQAEQARQAELEAQAKRLTEARLAMRDFAAALVAKSAFRDPTACNAVHEGLSRVTHFAEFSTRLRAEYPAACRQAFKSLERRLATERAAGQRQAQQRPPRDR